MKIIFDNGLTYDLSKDEITLLRLSLKGAFPLDVLCSAEREAELNSAYWSLLDKILENTLPANKVK